jgi:TonB family protein
LLERDASSITERWTERIFCAKPENCVNRFRFVAIAVLNLSAVLACDAQPVPQAPPSISAIPEISVPTYADNEQGLHKLMSDMMKLAKDGDVQGLAAYAKSLVLPNPDDWFNAAFGASRGPRYAAASEQGRLGIAKSAPANFSLLLRDKRTRIETHKFEDSCDEQATAKEYPLLAKRDGRVPMYDARFWDAAGTGLIWSYFAYVDGGFRYVGDLYVTMPVPKKPAAGSGSPPAPTNSTPQIRISGNVTAAQLIHNVTPNYPQEAKSRHISGDVKIHAVIGKDGQINEMDLVEGVCALSVPALDAVKNWRYKPTTLNGLPVEVDTTITVVFALGH